MTSHFRQLIDALPQAVLVHRGGRPLFVNAKFSGLTGCPPEDLNAVKSMVAADPWQRWLADSGEHAAVSVVDRRGQPLSLRARRTEVPWKGGPAWMETLDLQSGDGSEENGAEGNLEYRSLADGYAHGVLVHQNGKLLYVNPALVRLLGFASSKEAYRGNSALERFSPMDLVRLTHAAEAGANGDGVHPVDVQVEGPDAGTLWLSAFSTSIDWQGSPAIATTVMDVTDRRRAEHALQARERNQGRAEEVARIGHWEWHLASQNIVWSEGAYRIYGRTPETFQPTVKNALNAVHPDDREAVADALNIALREGRSFTQEFRALSPDGTVRPCVDQVTVELDASGNPERLFGVLMDVTDARRAERDLEESRRLLETVVESIPLCLFVKDTTGRFLLVNSAEAVSFNLTPEQMRGMRTEDVPGVAPSAIERALEEDRHVIASGQPLVDEQRRSPMSNDPNGWRRAVKVPLRNAQGRVVGIVGLSEDITQRVEAEQQLKAHQRLLNTVMEAIPHGLFVKDAAGNYLMTNTRYAEAFGQTPEALRGMDTEHLPGFTPEQLASTAADDEAILSSASSYIEREFPSPAPRTKGEMHRLIKVPMRDESGTVTAVVGMVEDVTARRQAEQRLRESEQLLKSVLESIPQALFVKDLDRRYILVNSLFASRFGMTQEQVHGLRSDELPGVTGRFLELTLEDDARALETGETIVRDDLAAPSPQQKGQWRRLIKRRLLDHNGEVIGTIGTTEDITQRKEAELRVQESEQLLQSVIESIPQGLFVKDPAGRYLLVNRQYTDRINTTPEAMRGKRLGELPGVLPEFAEMMDEDDRRTLESGVEQDREAQFEFPGQPSRWLHIIKRQLFDREGRVVGVIGTTEEVTQRREADLQLQESRRLLQTIIDTLPQAIFLKDTEGRFIVVNNAYAAIRNLTVGDILGRRTDQISHTNPGGVPRWMEMDEAVVRTGKPVTEAGYPYNYPDGHQGVRSLIKLPFFDTVGRMTGILGVSEDITARTEAVEQVHNSERLLQTLIDTLPQAIFLKDTAGKYIVVNDAYARAHRITKEEALRSTLQSLPHGAPEEREQWDRMERSVLETGTATVEEIIPFTIPGGGQRIRTLTKLPVLDANGTLTGVLGVSEDITERQQSEQRLRQSQRLLQTIIDTLPQAIFLKDAEGRYLVVNDAFSAIRGLPKNELVGAGNDALPHPAPGEVAEWNQDDRQVIQHGLPLGPKEYPFTMPNGSISTRVLYKLPFVDDAGAVIGVLGVSEDVTTRRAAEERVKESEQLLQTVIDTLPLDLWVKGRDRRYLRVNPAMARRWGMTPEAMVGQMAPMVDSAPEGEQGRIAQTDLQVLEEGRVVDLQMLRTEPNGQRRVHHQIKAPLRDANGAVIGLVGLAEDVTEIRRAEQQLRASEERLKLVLEATSDGWWDWNRPADRVEYSPTWLQYLGYSREEFDPTVAYWIELIHPEDRVRVKNMLDEAIASAEGLFQCEYRMRAKSGAWIWCLDRGKVVARDGAGEATRMVGVFMDIRARKRAEDELRASQRLLQTVFDTIPHPVFVKDREGVYTAVNRAMTDLWQAKPEEIVGHKVIRQAHRPETESQNTQRSDQEVISSGKASAFVRSQTLLDGKVHRLSMKKTPLVGGDGKVIGLVGVLEDITEREAAQENLRSSQRLLNAIINAIPMGVSAKDTQGRYIIVNPTTLSAYRCTAEDMLGRTATEVPWFSKEDARRYVEEDRRVLSTGKAVEIPEEEHTLPGGPVIMRRVIKSPILEDDGKVVGLVLVTEDITRRKLAEQELLRSKGLLQTIFDTIPLDIHVKDLDSRIVAMNRRMLTAFDLKESDLQGRQTPIPVSAEEMEGILRADREVMSSGVLTDEVHHRKLRDGSQRHYRVIKSPLRDDSGKTFGLVGIAEDISERLAADAALQRSRALLQTVFDTIPHDVWVKDRDARYVSANRRMLEGFGTTIDRVVGNQTAIPATPSELELILKSDFDVIHGGHTLDLVQARTLPDGSLRQFRLIKTPLRDETGQIAGLVGIAEDVTERLRSEQELRESRQLLQAVFDALPLWVFVKSPDSTILMVNRQMAADYGTNPVGVKTNTPNDPADQATQEMALSLDRRALESNGPVEITDYRHTIRGQPTRILRSLRTAIRDATGKPTFIVGISEDITERKRAEQALLQTQKLESLGILAGGIAHDFNNLLTGILGNVELALLEMDPSHHARGSLNNVKNASLMAAGLTRQMLAYSGGGRFELRPIILNSLVEDMAQLLRVTVPRHVNVIYQFQPNLPHVQADESQLQQVIMNLITNAAEAIGDRPGDVVLTTGTAHATRAELATYHLAGDVQEGDYVLLQVADTGTGMAPATLQRIFDPFFTTKFTGRGLGLAAVLGIVRSHHGTIRVTSELGRGTTFRILLPPAGAAAELPADTVSDWTGGGTVLVVDDEAHVRQVSARMLRQLGMDVLEASGGEEALRMVREHKERIGWVLLDASMPGLSGPDTLRSMRELAPELVVVMMSGFGERELQERFHGMNVRGFLQKPFTFEDLSTKLSAWLGVGSVGTRRPS